MLCSFFSFATKAEQYNLDMSYVGFFIVLPIILILHLVIARHLLLRLRLCMCLCLCLRLCHATKVFALGLLNRRSSWACSTQCFQRLRPLLSGFGEVDRAASGKLSLAHQSCDAVPDIQPAGSSAEGPVRG